MITERCSKQACLVHWSRTHGQRSCVTLYIRLPGTKRCNVPSVVQLGRHSSSSCTALVIHHVAGDGLSTHTRPELPPFQSPTTPRARQTSDSSLTTTRTTLCECDLCVPPSFAMYSALTLVFLLGSSKRPALFESQASCPRFPPEQAQNASLSSTMQRGEMFITDALRTGVGG